MPCQASASLRVTFSTEGFCPLAGRAILGGRLCLTLWVTDKDVLVLAGKTFPRPVGLETVECRGPVCKSLPWLLNRAMRDVPLSQSVAFNHVKLSNMKKEINTLSGRFTDSLEDNGGGRVGAARAHVLRQCQELVAVMAWDGPPGSLYFYKILRAG